MTTDQKNLLDAFVAIRRSLQAREVLVALDTHSAGNDELFYHWLRKIGLGPSYSDLGNLLDQLEAEGLIATEQVEHRRVIKPTRAGAEIAQARTQVDWIARPEPQ